MKSALETTRREVWEELVVQYPEETMPEHRRKQHRRDAVIGTAELAFEVSGHPIVRSGNLLNVSSEGILIKEQVEIRPGTLVFMQLVLAEGAATLGGCVVHCTETVGGYKIGIQLLFTDEEE